MSYVIAPLAFLLAATPWVLFLGSRLGRLMGAAVVAIGSLSAVLAVEIASALLRFDVVVAVFVLAAVVLGGGLVALSRDREWRTVWRAGRRTILVWLPAGLGGAVWVFTVLISRLVPGSASRAWALNGDTINNLDFVRIIVADRGVLLGEAENPVPLLSALLTGVVEPLRPQQRALALAHDFDAAVVFWSILIAATCVLFGVIFGNAIPRERPALAAVVAAIGSIIPLTWMVTGIALQWGWMNVHLSIVLVLLALLAQTGARRHPLVALASHSLLTTLLLATWSPFAFLPAALAVTVLLRHQDVLRRLSAAQVVLLALAAGQLVAWVLVSTVPATIAQRQVLTIDGQGAPAMLLPLACLTLVLIIIAIRARRAGRTDEADAVIAVAAAGAVGVALLFGIARDDSDPIGSYYPSKFAWLATVTTGVVVVAAVLARLSRSRRPAGRMAAVGITGAFVVSSSLLPIPPAHLPSAVRFSPLAIATGGIWNEGDRTVDRVLELAQRPDWTILWNSGDPDEPMIDFLLLLSGPGDIEHPESQFRNLAYHGWVDFRDSGKWEVPGALVCAGIASEGTVTIITADRDLEAEINSRCELFPRIELVG